jgi:hypothetical protein
VSENVPQNQEVQFSAPDDGGWHHTVMRDWIAVCPDIGPTAFRLYAITRSLLIEKRGQVRKLTLLELCKLLPGPNGKPSGLGRIRDAVRELSAVGLYTTPDGKPITTSSSAKAAEKPMSIRINDYPAKGWAYQGPRNAFAALDAVRGEADNQAEEGDSDPGWISNQGQDAGWKSNQVGQKSNQAGWESNHSEPVTSENAAPKEDLEGRSTSKGEVVTAVGQSPVVGGVPAGGFAASDKQDPPDKVSPRGISRAVAALPQQIRDRLPEFVPAAVTDPIESELRRGITSDQFAARIQSRWNLLYAEDADTEHGGRGLDSAVGVAAALVRRGRCLDARCDDGTNIDDGQPCRACERDAEDRRLARLPKPATVRHSEPQTKTYTAPAYVPEQPDGDRTLTSDQAAVEARAGLQAGRAKFRQARR